MIARLTMAPWQCGSMARVPSIVQIAFGIWAIAITVYFTKLPLLADPVAVFGCAGLAAAVLMIPMSGLVRVGIAVAVSLVMRLVIDAWTPHLANDPLLYQALATGLNSGRGLTVDVTLYGDGLRAVYPPIYPLLLAAFQGQYIALNMAVDIVCAAAIFRLTGSAKAVAAYLIFPSTMLFGAAPAKEGLALAIAMSAMLVRSPVSFGALSAAMALTQPAYVMLLPLFWLIQRRGSKANGLAALTAIVCMIPWWLRNLLLLGHFVPLTTSAGLSLAVAANHGHVATRDIPLDEVGRSSSAAAQALSVIAADPASYASYVGKVFLTAMINDSDASSLLATTRVKWAVAALWASQVALAALVASAAAVRRFDPRVGAMAIAFALNCFVGLWFEFSTRHRALIIPLLIVYVAQARARHRAGNNK